MKGMYFYRGFFLRRNTIVNNGKKWIASEGEKDIFGQTLNETKNNIDDYVGGHPTAKIPKRKLD